MNEIKLALKSKLSKEDEKLEEVGVKIGKLYTEMGFPIDMALDRINLDIPSKIAVLNGALGWFIQHKRNSGAGEGAIERQRKLNNKILTDYITRGEVDIY